MKKLHSILRNLALFLCVALPIIYCVGLVVLIYAVSNNEQLVSYYAIKAVALITVVTTACILGTIWLGLHLTERR